MKFREIVSGVLFCLIGLCFADSDMRAIYSIWGYTNSAPTSINSDESLTMLRGLGYNTFIEFIAAPEAGLWNNSNGITLTPAARTERVNYVRDQKQRMDALGFEYVPFFNEWGWGAFNTRVEERTRAMVYREVDIIQTVGYYGSDIYPNLSKTQNSLGEGNTNPTWAADFSNVEFSYSNRAEGSARVVVETEETVNPTTTLSNGQLYNLHASVDLTNSNFKVGDRITVFLFREFDGIGNKPDVARIPLGQTLPSTPSNLFNPQNIVTYTVTDIDGAGNYEINEGAVIVSGNTFEIDIEFWTERFFRCGIGNYQYNRTFMLDFNLFSNGTSVASTVRVDNIEIMPQDPVSVVFGREWEGRVDYATILANYPLEVNREVKAVYEDGSGTRTEISHFQDPPPPGQTLVMIKGHFIPATTDMGTTPHQMTVDPLSPATDMITRQMLEVIRDGLGGVEPKYFFITSDEVFIYRRGINNTPHGPLSNTLNTATNGEYFAEVIKLHIDRYKDIFGVAPGSPANTSFKIWGDMIIPFGGGYQYFAESYTDEDAITILGGLVDDITVAIWAYDYMFYPKPWEDPKVFMLNSTQAMINDNIDRLQAHGLKYIATYATDGGQGDIAEIDPSITNDQPHIDHEIDMAKKWTELVNAEPQGFEGYVYTGWEPPIVANRWNGMFSLAYFGWLNPQSAFVPNWWRSVSANPGDNGEPVLEVLANTTVPWAFQSAVSLRDAGYHESNISKPLLIIRNESSSQTLEIESMKIWFSREEFPSGQFDYDVYYTNEPGYAFSIEEHPGNPNIIAVKVDFPTGFQLLPGEETSPDAVQFGVHYDNHYPGTWNKTNDWSWLAITDNFTETVNVTLYDSDDNLIFGEEPLASQSTMPPSSSLSDILGFEEISDWNISTGGIAHETVIITEGANSLEITGGGYQEIYTRPFEPGLSQAVTGLSVDIFIGTNQPFSWVGQLGLIVDAPSQGIHDRYISNSELTGLPIGSFSTINFTLSTEIGNLFYSGLSDLTIKFVLNTNSLSGPYYLDNVTLQL